MHLQDIFCKKNSGAFFALLLFTFWESLLISQSSGSAVTFFAVSIPLMSVFMFCLICGALLGGALDIVQQHKWMPGIFALASALLLLLSSHFHEDAHIVRATAAVLAGMQLPRILTLLAVRAPLRVQAFILASAHALAEVCMLTAGLRGAVMENFALHQSDVLLALTIAALGVLLLSAGRLTWSSRVDVDNDLAQKQVRYDVALLVLAVLLFFLLHATHDYAFRLYTFIHEGPPVWLRMCLRLTFPLLALVAAAWGLMPLVAVSVAMSALAPALDLFAGNTMSYWIVYTFDTIGLHGGLFFFILAFARIPHHLPCASLLRIVPCLSLYLTFGGMGIFYENIQTDSLYMMLACLVMLGMLLAILLCMQSRWSVLLHSDNSALLQPSTPMAALETISQIYPSETVVKAFADAHNISPRETQVLRLICEGMSYAQMAERLCIAENTIKIHVGRILKKSDVPSRNRLMSKVFHPTIKETCHT